MIWSSCTTSRRLGLWRVALVLLAFGALGDTRPSLAQSTPRRIVSLAPSITEIVFALDLGDRLVGVTRYCDHPAAASGIAKVGGYIDPSYEAIASLKPDLIILLASHRDTQSQLERLHLRTLSTPHQTIQDIHQAIRLIGAACGGARAAEMLLSQLDRRTQATREAVRNKERPRVMVCIAREVDSGQLTGMHVAGRSGFYDQIIELAGGQNACTNTAVAFPQLSAEGVIRLDPEVIIDLQSERVSRRAKPAEIERQWARLGMVRAVRNARVYALFGDKALRPGPRYIDFLEQLARFLHPEAFPDPGSHDIQSHPR